MDVQLNFLQYNPTTNWLDYFLERKTLFELLSRKPIDRSAVISLCDQFVEQAMNGDRDFAAMERKQSMGNDELICTRHKIDDLWLCALSCFASCDWDLSLLIKGSNVIRVWALLNRLVRWAFEFDTNDDVTQRRDLLVDDPFTFLCSLTPTNTSKVFFGWLYSRWILKIDLDGRFPVPPARPTVSNPYVLNLSYFSVDQSLLQAERLSQVALEVRSRMGEAVGLLTRLAKNDQLGPDDRVEVPTMMCFFPHIDTVTKKTSLPLLSCLPGPDSGGEMAKVAWRIFRQKTLFDLMVAHFSSKHFQMAKHFLSKIPNKMENDGQLFSGDLLSIDESELRGYRRAFDMDDKQCSNQQPTSSVYCSDPLLDFVRRNSANDKNCAKPIVQLLSSGICRLSMLQLNRIRENEETRRSLIEELSTELLRFPHGARSLSPSASLRYVRLCGCAYFLCALSPGFVESLSKHAQRLLEPPHTLNTRPVVMGQWAARERTNEPKKLLAVLASVSVSQPPSDDHLRELTSSGPSLWTIVTSFDIAILYNTFVKYHSHLHISEQKMVFSPVLSEPILHLSSSAGDKLKMWNQIMLWKLEQLARLGNIAKWKELLNKFVEASASVRENAALKSFFIYDTVRIELVNWCRDCCRPNDAGEFARRSTTLQGLLNSTLSIACKNEHNVFQRFGMELAHYLMNSRQWRLANDRIKGQQLFKTPFTDIAVILEVFLFKLYDERKRDEAYKVVRDVFWIVISPTFDEIRQGVEFRTALINKNSLLEFLQGIKDPDVLGIFFGMAASLYNFSLTTAPTALIDGTASDDPYQQMQNAGAHLVRAVSQQIYVENHELWQTIRLDEYRNRPLDVPFIKQVLAVLCQQAPIAGPIRAPWLRVRADYAFVCERYEEAVRLYLEMLMALQRGLLVGGIDEMDAGGTDRMAQKMDTDLSCVYFVLRRCTAKSPLHCTICECQHWPAIIGQMRVDVSPHLDLVEHLLRNTPLTVDAGHVYFPLIADIHLMEKMAATYEKFDLLLYQQTLLKQMPTRAINVNNSPVILERESVRRRQRFMEIVFRQFGEQHALCTDREVFHQQQQQQQPTYNCHHLSGQQTHNGRLIGDCAAPLIFSRRRIGAATAAAAVRLHHTQSVTKMVMSRVWCCCWCCCRRRVVSGEGQRRGRPSGADGTRRRQRDGSKAKLAKFFGIFYSMDDELEEDNNSSSNRKGQPEPIGKEDAETEPMIWRRRGEEEEAAAASSSQMRQQKELADSATVPSTVSSSKCVMEAKGQHRFALKFEDTEYIVDVNSRGAADREAEGAVQQQNFRLYRRSHSLAGKVPPALPNLLSSSSPAQIRPKMSVVGRMASLFVSDDSSAASSTAGGEGAGGAGGAGGGGTRRKRPSLLGMIGVGGQRGRRSVSAFIPALFQRQKSGETETVAESDAPGEEERQRRMVGDAVENWSRQFSSSTSPNGRRRRRRHDTNEPFSSSQCADAVLLPTAASPAVHVQPRQKMPSVDGPVRFCAPFPAMPAQQLGQNGRCHAPSMANGTARNRRHPPSPSELKQRSAMMALAPPSPPMSAFLSRSQSVTHRVEANAELIRDLALSSSSTQSPIQPNPFSVSLLLLTGNMMIIGDQYGFYQLVLRKHACRLRYVLHQLNSGQLSLEDLKRNIEYAALVLETAYMDETRRICDEDDDLAEVTPEAVPDEVREWLTATFTRQAVQTRREKPKFKSVANAIRTGIFFENRIYRRTQTVLAPIPNEYLPYLRQANNWNFDTFDLNEVTNGHSLKYVGFELFNRYGFLERFKIHAADVTQTSHWMLSQTGLASTLTDLEMLAVLFGALIHDYEHTGHTNNFHIQSGSNFALLYNDRSVLENHHASSVFRLMKDDDKNIFDRLTKDEHREMRTMIIEIVLATDMSTHFVQIKTMKNMLTLPEGIDKMKALCLIVHACDMSVGMHGMGYRLGLYSSGYRGSSPEAPVPDFPFPFPFSSHASKPWELHHRWTEGVLEEFFRQGDLEASMGLPYSPLCDRHTVHVADSQIGFIDFIVEPTMVVCGEMLVKMVEPLVSLPTTDCLFPPTANHGGPDDGSASATSLSPLPPDLKSPAPGALTSVRKIPINYFGKLDIPCPWTRHLQENKAKWRERALNEEALRNKSDEEDGAREKPLTNGKPADGVP
ncbi:hypothetical protein GPALN_006357 [Globodera pallida]|nr:hypothetical protein GPALN_006357 [Globodera pallida]